MVQNNCVVTWHIVEYCSLRCVNNFKFIAVNLDVEVCVRIYVIVSSVSYRLIFEIYRVE